MGSIIMTAKTLEEAITKACVELGVTSDKLDYKITAAGSRGVLGIGARPYTIEAKIREDISGRAAGYTSETISDRLPDTASGKKTAKEPAFDKLDKFTADTPVSIPVDSTDSGTGERNDRRHDENPEPAEASEPDAVTVQPQEKQSGSLSEERVKNAEEKAGEFLKKVCSDIGVDVDINFSYNPEYRNLDIELTGNGMGVLIGKRGQTLDSLQYLVSQIVNRSHEGFIRIKLDTESYRERRKETLETLAQNIACKVRRTKRPVALEPMNPYERRIIHSTLQNEPDVTTRSEGEDSYRHVVVFPVRAKGKHIQ